MDYTNSELSCLSKEMFKVIYQGHKHTGIDCPICREMWNRQSDVFNHTAGDMNSYRQPALQPKY